MSAKRPVAKLKKQPKAPAGPRVRSRQVAGRGSAAVPEEVASPASPAGTFDPLAVLLQLNGGKTKRDYADKQTIYSQGDPADAVYFVISGKVKLTVVSKRGKEAVVAVLNDGCFFGEGCLAGQPFRMATATSIQRSSILRVEKPVVVGMLKQQPAFAERFLAYVLTRNIRMEADLVDHLFNSSEKRLARLLLLLAHFGQDSKPIPVIAKMSQEMLAEMVGTTRSRVSYFLNRFRDLGFIDYSSEGMHVHSSLVSVVLHD